MNEQERELDLMVAELDTENRMIRARNERLEKELAALRGQAPLLVDKGCSERGCMGYDSRDCGGEMPVMYVKLESK
jgi:hypothetical protein